MVKRNTIKGDVSSLTMEMYEADKETYLDATGKKLRPGEWIDRLALAARASENVILKNQIKEHGREINRIQGELKRKQERLAVLENRSERQDMRKELIKAQVIEAPEEAATVDPAADALGLGRRR